MLKGKTGISFTCSLIKHKTPKIFSLFFKSNQIVISSVLKSFKLSCDVQQQRNVMEELAHSRQGFEQVLLAKNRELELTKVSMVIVTFRSHSFCNGSIGQPSMVIVASDKVQNHYLL